MRISLVDRLVYRLKKEVALWGMLDNGNWNSLLVKFTCIADNRGRIRGLKWNFLVMIDCVSSFVYRWAVGQIEDYCHIKSAYLTTCS